MAIKDKNFDEQAMGVAPLTIGQLLEMLQTMEPQLGYDTEIELICDSTVKHLVGVFVPPHAGELKKFRSDLLKIGDLLESIVKRSDNYEQIILTSLQTLYKLIVSTGKWAPSTMPFSSFDCGIGILISLVIFCRKTIGSGWHHFQYLRRESARRNQTADGQLGEHRLRCGHQKGHNDSVSLAENV